MPIHDWFRVDANFFHDFHQAWTIDTYEATWRTCPEEMQASVERGVVE